MLDFAVKPVGDCALSAEFAEEISVRVNQQVHALDELLRAAAIPGVVETVPTYRTLIIHYRPEVISYQALRDRVLRERGRPGLRRRCGQPGDRTARPLRGRGGAGAGRAAVRRLGRAGDRPRPGGGSGL